MRDQLLTLIRWGLLLAAAGLFALGWLACLAAGGDPPVYLPLTKVRVQDGDTLRADIELPYGLAWQGRTIRIEDFDAWETSRARRTIGPIDDEELAKGQLAKQALAALAFSGRLYILADRQPRWSYGRLIGRVYVQPFDAPALVDVGDWMRERGHARPTDPVLEAIERTQAPERPP